MNNNQASVSAQYQLIVDETIRQLDSIMRVPFKERAKDLVKKMMGRSVRTKDPMFWHAGMLMLGLVTALGKSGDFQHRDKILRSLSVHFDLWQKNYDGKIDFVDDAVAGYCFVKLYEETKEIKYKEAADKVYAFIVNAKTDEEGSVIYNPSRNSANIFADGIGQVTMFLGAYARMMVRESDDDIRICTDIIENLLINYYKNAFDEKSGLHYHGYVANGHVRKGLLGWGRAEGWMIMGLSQVAILFNKYPNLVNIKNSSDYIEMYKDLSVTLLDYQREDGGFSWQIQGTDGHLDTSATGMIGFSIAAGYKEKLFDDGHKKFTKSFISERLKKVSANIYVNSSEGRVLNALSSCDDFGVHYQNYGNYPWGQGAGLCCIALLQ
ncbi:glycoside hydrolase family 88 protein [Butyrivibrio proteoclasticus]|uniref:glycoside hydrolase family 88 protein n=1 Tax=Butyrivibrio proteoclasticus TaxID=43305 RepID=UPI0004791215|nr:glycoside hydrolase family 88 protein [Butyrivibrio proteoclasticus]